MILLLLPLAGLFPWSGLNCWRNDVDIKSGRIRYTRYLFWVPVMTSVRSSSLTSALLLEDLAGRKPDWYAVVTLSPGVHYSPHHRYHGAMAHIRELEMCWEFGKMTPAARRETARNLLRTWQETASYYPAGEYIEKVFERTLVAEKKGKVIDVSDLPKP